MLKEKSFVMYYKDERLPCSETYTNRDAAHIITHYVEFANDTICVVISIFKNKSVYVYHFDKHGVEVKHAITRLERMNTKNPTTFITSARDLLNNTKP